MASHLDLEEQEQLAELKHFWKTYGNLISWVLILVLGGYAAWNGWQYWQRNQAAKASALYDEVEKAVLAQDVARVERGMTDMKERFAATQYAHQAALLAARVLVDKNQGEQARAWLAWSADKAPSAAWRDLARVRLAAAVGAAVTRRGAQNPQGRFRARDRTLGRRPARGPPAGQGPGW